MAGERDKKGKGKYEPVTSYTFSSTMIYIPVPASLCAATSATEKVFDILPAPYLFPHPLSLSLSIDSKFGIKARKNAIYDAEKQMG